MRLIAVALAFLGIFWEGLGVYVLFSGEPEGVNWEGAIGLQMITVVLLLGSIAFSLIANSSDRQTPES